MKINLRYFHFHSILPPMEPLKQAAELLRETEAKLRGLLSTAATSGDYASVVQIAAWARALAELTKTARSDQNQITVPRSSPPAMGNATIEKVIKQVSSRAWRQAYPKFFRQEDELIRIAWSKREKREYRHKAPRGVLKALAEAMAERGANGRVFSTDQLLPIHDGADRGEIPNYQAYACISLLKQAGLIDQHGRQGYSIPRPNDFKGAVEAVWNKLPES